MWNYAQQSVPGLWRYCVLAPNRPLSLAASGTLKTLGKIKNLILKRRNQDDNRNNENVGRLC